MKAIKAILILCVTICFTSSCKKDLDMTLKQKTQFENADLRQIEVGDAWELHLVADTVTYVEVDYSAYLEPYLKVRMEGTKLEVGFTTKVYPTLNSVFRATVHTPHLDKLEAQDAAQVRCEGILQGHETEVSLAEASRCHGLEIEGESCLIKLDDASVMTGLQFVGKRFKAVLEDASQFNGELVATENTEIDLGDASRFVGKGTSGQASLRLTDACILNMAETEVGAMTVELSDGSVATVFVTQTLDGTLTDGSTLYYKGNPQKNIECSDDSRLVPF